MKIFKIFFVAGFLFSFSSQAARKVLNFVGEAYDIKDRTKLIYREFHKLEFGKDKKIISSETSYKDPAGQELAYLHSDFSKSLSAPAHLFEDRVLNCKYGIRYKDERLLIFSQDEGKEEESKDFTDLSKKPDVLNVGGQGLFHYLRTEYNTAKEKKKTTVLLFIPGQLDYYTFELEFKDEKDGVAKLELHAKNFFLRLVAPELVLHYDVVQQRLIDYEGISNLRPKDGKPYLVYIKYIYN